MLSRFLSGCCGQIGLPSGHAASLMQTTNHMYPGIPRDFNISLRSCTRDETPDITNSWARPVCKRTPVHQPPACSKRDESSTFTYASDSDIGPGQILVQCPIWASLSFPDTESQGWWVGWRLIPGYFDQVNDFDCNPGKARFANPR